MSFDDFRFASLETTDIEKIKSVENQLNSPTDANNEIIVLAFAKKSR